ncbi:hypothetical protein UPYG_G00012690 [Umbra pygmaea]|uniref:Uncharacterized protein n=1 Tax=Umbra pygmaea TaxID=75934 RepID=A0ABD0Y6A0_UMBPY
MVYWGLNNSLQKCHKKLGINNYLIYSKLSETNILYIFTVYNAAQKVSPREWRYPLIPCLQYRIFFWGSGSPDKCSPLPEHAHPKTLPLPLVDPHLLGGVQAGQHRSTLPRDQARVHVLENRH